MFRKNELKKIVLECVQELHACSSRDVLNRLSRLGVSRSRENISMTLRKCAGQRLHACTERGRRRLAYYISKEREVNRGVVDIDDTVREARDQIEPLVTSALASLESARNICNNTRRTGVLLNGQQIAIMSTYLFLQNPN